MSVLVRTSTFIMNIPRIVPLLQHLCGMYINLWNVKDKLMDIFIYLSILHFFYPLAMVINICFIATFFLHTSESLPWKNVIFRTKRKYMDVIN